MGFPCHYPNIYIYTYNLIQFICIYNIYTTCSKTNLYIYKDIRVLLWLQKHKTSCKRNVTSKQIIRCKQIICCSLGRKNLSFWIKRCSWRCSGGLFFLLFLTPTPTVSKGEAVVVNLFLVLFTFVVAVALRKYSKQNMSSIYKSICLCDYVYFSNISIIKRPQT